MVNVIQQLTRGDHTAFFYRNRSEQFAAAVPFIRIGLERNERCLYIAGDNSVRMVWDALAAGGVDIERHTHSGALRIQTVQESYLRCGTFDPQKMIADLQNEVSAALNLGYSAFRGTGEMLWATRQPDTLNKLLEYEAQLDKVFPSKFVAMCQYNEPCFDPEITAEILRMHFKIIARGRLTSNRYYSPGGKWNSELAPLSIDALMACS